MIGQAKVKDSRVLTDEIEASVPHNAQQFRTSSLEKLKSDVRAHSLLLVWKQHQQWHRITEKCNECQQGPATKISFRLNKLVFEKIYSQNLCQPNVASN